MTIVDFQKAVIHYAKGNYISGWSMIEDLKTIAQRTDNDDNLEFIIDQIAHIAITAIKEASNPISPLTEYQEQLRFLITNKEFQKKYGPDPTDSEDVYQKKLTRAYQESVVASVLVVIARWMTKLDLGEPDPQILSVRSPKKEKKDG
jgi:hypothetical protein